MYCPQCSAEYRPEFDRCADCDVDLVQEPPPAEDHHATPFVTVFETSETDIIPVIKSILRGAELPFNTKGEAMMNLFPSDLLGRTMSRPGAEVSFEVPETFAEQARQLLTEQELPEGHLEPPGGEKAAGETEDEP